MKDLVEITEEYENGVLISYKANGIELRPGTPFQDCKSITIHKMMSREEVNKFYGNV